MQGFYIGVEDCGTEPVKLQVNQVIGDKEVIPEGIWTRASLFERTRTKQLVVDRKRVKAVKENISKHVGKRPRMRME